LSVYKVCISNNDKIKEEVLVMSMIDKNSLENVTEKEIDSMILKQI